MGSDTDHIRIVWEAIQIPFGVYGFRYRPHTDCMNPIQIPYGLYGTRYKSHAECIGPDTDSVRSVWDPIQTPYGLYEPDTDHIGIVRDPIQFTYGMYGTDTDSLRSVLDPIQIPYGVYVVRYRTHTACMGPDTDPIRTRKGLPNNAKGPLRIPERTF